MTPRLAVAACCLAAGLLGGCAIEVPFDARWGLAVAAPPGLVTVGVPMDLAEQPAIWTRRERVDEVKVEAVRLTVVAVGSRNRAGEMALALRYRPEGAPETGEQDVTAVEWVAVPLEEGAVVEVVAPAPLGGALLETLRGTGKFTLMVEEETSTPVEATVELALAGTAVVTL